MRRTDGPRLFPLAPLATAFMYLTLAASSSPAQDGRKLISNPKPTYPETARRLSLTGTVKVEIVIAPDGHISETHVIGGHPLLVEATQQALKNWKYSPATTESTTIVEFHFNP